MLLVLDADGEVACSLGPDLQDAAPDLEAVPASATGHLVTVRSLDGHSRWRLRVVSDSDSGQSVVLAVSLADADATVRRLTWISSGHQRGRAAAHCRRVRGDRGYRTATARPGSRRPPRGSPPAT